MNVVNKNPLKLFIYLNISVLRKPFSFLSVSSPLSNYYKQKPEVSKKTKQIELEYSLDERNNQDYQWFKKVKENVHKHLQLDEVRGDKEGILDYELSLKRMRVFNYEGIPFLDFMNMLLLLGISTYRKFYLQVAQRIMIELLQKLKSSKKLDEYTVFLQRNIKFKDLSVSEQNFTRKTLPNLILSFNNLQIFDSEILQIFDRFFTVYKEEIFNDYLITNQTILAVFWALINSETTENKILAPLLKNLFDYLWYHKEKMDLINLLRFVWVLSYYDKIEDKIQKEAFQKLMHFFSKIPAFSFNYKNATNISQILMNFYPEISQQFFLSEDYNGEKYMEKIKDSNKYKELFPSFYPLCFTSFAICKMNSNYSKKIIFNESFLQELPSFLLSSNSIKNTGRTFEKNVEKALDNLKLNYEKNVRLGIYEIDFLVQGDLILEINGDSHTIFSVDGNRFPKSKKITLKLKHLKLFGIKKFAMINFMEWEKIDYSKEKKEQFLLTAIKTAQNIE